LSHLSSQSIAIVNVSCDANVEYRGLLKERQREEERKKMEGTGKGRNRGDKDGWK
jgi:hypothetical protein